MLRRAFLAIITLSGLSALVYQVAWTRQLTVLFGASTHAVATVLAAFLGGLALGAWLLGDRLDRARRPLRAYALLEAGIGLYAFLFPAILAVAQRLYVAVASSADPSLTFRTLVRAVLATAILLPPTFLMGGTLPAMCRVLVRRDAAVGRDLGILYACNTLGAALGALLAGFALLALLGLEGSIFLAGALNLLLASVAGWLARGETAVPDGGPPPAATPAGGRSEPPGDRGLAAWVLAAMALSGFAALGYEVLWTRALVAALHTGFTYAFSLMLATFLLGLVLGSAFYARFLSGSRQPLRLLARLQLLLGGWALLSVWWIGKMPYLEALAAERGLLTPLYTWATWLGEITVAAALVMLVPTMLLGVCFPLAGRLVVLGAADVGRGIGRLYGFNTIGSILGSLTTGFLLVPRIGTLNALTVLAGLNLLVGTALAWRGAGRREAAGATLAAAGLLSVCVAVTPAEYFRDSLKRVRAGELLYYAEDVTGIAEIYEQPSNYGGTYRRLYVNGTSYASSADYARRYHKLLGHLPALLHPDPARALVIAFGTGMTAGALTHHDEVRQVDCVDLSRAVFGGASQFAAANGDVVHDPKVRLVVEDGRNHLLLDPEPYDVITLEPPPPRYAGVANLYSEEFYALCRDRLAPGGRVAQWIPMHSHTEEEMRMLVRAFVDVFPYRTLWIPVQRDAILVGSVEPHVVDLSRFAARMAQPAVAADLADIDVDGPLDLAATLFADTDLLDDYVRGYGTITDDRPAIEYFAGHRFIESPVHLERILAYRLPEAAFLASLAGVRDDPGLHEEALADYRAMGHYYRGAVQGERGNPAGRLEEWKLAAETAPGGRFFRDQLPR